MHQLQLPTRYSVLKFLLANVSKLSQDNLITEANFKLICLFVWLSEFSFLLILKHKLLLPSVLL